MVFANREASGQTACMGRLIQVFPVCTFSYKAKYMVMICVKSKTWASLHT